MNQHLGSGSTAGVGKLQYEPTMRNFRELLTRSAVQHKIAPDTKHINLSSEKSHFQIFQQYKVKIQ